MTDAKLVTVTLGTISFQGELVGKLSNCRAIVKDGNTHFVGKLVKCEPQTKAA